MIIRKDDYGIVSIVENNKYQYGVMNSAGEMVVPFGKYTWISGFEHGLARVQIKSETVEDSINSAMHNIFECTDKKIKLSKKWGIINESGEEVLSPIYDEIWNFFRKGRCATNVVLYGETKKFNLITRKFEDNYRSLQTPHSHPNDYYREHSANYGEFAGSYAQDVMGYSDDVINDAFEGDPDLYWNID